MYNQPVNSKPKSWLENWSKQTKQKQTFNKEKAKDSVNNNGPKINESALKQLQQLYGKHNEEALGTFASENNMQGAELEFRRLPELNKEFNNLKIKHDKDQITADLSNVGFDD